MTKQEFMAMSLPYGLKIIRDDNEVETISALGDSFQYQISGRSFAYGWYGETFDCTPILRPLSDLTKPIEHKGEKFVPIDRLLEAIVREWNMCNINYPNDAKGLYGDIIKNITSCEFWIIQKLIEWHFDLFGGIESEEAIDVNTLETNPYK